MNKEELTFDGFVFANKDDLEIAKNEARKIDYLEKHTDTSNMANMRNVYEKLIETNAFCTPVGFLYLREIRDALVASGVPDEEIAPVPLYTTFKRLSLKDEDKPKRRMTIQQKKEMSIRMKYRNAVLTAIIFGVMAIAMFAITWYGSTPNIINYKKAITDQYSAWEQDLTARENALREKERELNR
ncbi:MAG: hypothetical protein K6E19_00875 [Lachnospiraceae bacterium]|nr:hypothetical protein [Lachnospiraceae bacterium]